MRCWKKSEVSSIFSFTHFTLKRQLSLANGVSIILGLIIGSGIYITPQKMLEHVKSPGLSLIYWGFGGLYTFIAAYCLTEVAIKYPVSGEKYAYMNILYGPYYAFFYIWQYLFLARPGSNALKAIILGRYLLKPLFLNCDVPNLAVMLISSVFAFAISFLNCISVQLSAKFQGVLTFISVFSLVLLSSIGVYKLAKGEVENLQNLFEGSSTHPGHLILGFYSTVFSFYGWSALNFLIEELKNPLKNLPRAIVISVLFVSFFFVMVNLTFFLVLGREGVMQSEAVAISTAIEVFGDLGWIISIMIAITSFSGFSSGIMVGSRLTMAGARNGHLPRILSYISIEFRTPIIALIFQCLLSLMYVWVLDVSAIIQNVMFANFVVDFLVEIAYIKVRLKEKVDKPKFQVSRKKINDFQVGVDGFASQM
ncbi:hypothetical protein HELRODRAFT_84043 [Helobdella robusta]|uniref:Amino acid permease/ SLC12A domain-containing protein n=1 Tax=Helobdella robusta TaxID=6412 RepID=T1G5D8_HELRO|nr:hypothetical protein HELRODRAFT_84043 [Helobdella robusta]ESN99648.1 hypothetical protein HELRODRAFT_84043 [Helobdella robusta]